MTNSKRALPIFLVAVAALVVSLAGRGGALSAEFVGSTAWEYEVFEYNVDLVGSIAIGQDGELFVSLESLAGGRVLRLHRGERVVVVSDLGRPDGLLLRPPFLYITEHVEGGRVIRLDLRDYSRTELAILASPEGIDFLPGGDLAVAEEVGGRVLRIAESGRAEILAEGLREPEGLAVSADGTIYVAESKSGRVLAISKTGISVVVAGLNNPDQLAFAPDGSLWISEDAKPGRLLRYASGRLEVVVAGLMDAQGIAFGQAGEVFVAEPGRDRILRLWRTAPSPYLRLRRCSFLPRFQRPMQGWSGCVHGVLTVWEDRL